MDGKALIMRPTSIQVDGFGFVSDKELESQGDRRQGRYKKSNIIGLIYINCQFMCHKYACRLVQKVYLLRAFTC